MKYFISAGEASGDLHASMLIRNLRKIDADAYIKFMGGDHMTEEWGAGPLVHINEMSVMGFGEVIRNLPLLLNRLGQIKEILKTWHPDALVLVDYPSFNLKLAKFAHKLGIKVFWYISPKVWVWKEYRVKKMRRYVDRLFCILPFEVDYFKKRHNWDVYYVGNPSAEEVINFRKKTNIDKDSFFKAHDVKAEHPILALIPGSRTQEVIANLPIMVEVAKRHPEFSPLIAGLSDVSSEIYDRFRGNIPVIKNDTYNLLMHSNAALVTSGTATLETALFKVPQVMLYRHSGSKLMYKLFRRFLKVDYFSLPNLINGNETISEVVMHYCVPDVVEQRLVEIIKGGENHEVQQANYDRMTEILGTASPSHTVACEIYKTLESYNKV